MRYTLCRSTFLQFSCLHGKRIHKAAEGLVEDKTTICRLPQQQYIRTVLCGQMIVITPPASMYVRRSRTDLLVAYMLAACFALDSCQTYNIAIAEQSADILF